MSKNWTRREILETLALITGAVALPTSSWAKNDSGDSILLPDETNLFKKPVSAITLGAGNRGNVYGNYSVEYPEQLNIVGVAEPIEIRIDRYSEKHSISKNHQFQTWEDVFDVPKFADTIIITTPDDLHYGPCMKALEMGYDILLEKPIAPTETECRNILSKAKETSRIVAVCHVLRYAPYFN